MVTATRLSLLEDVIHPEPKQRQLLEAMMRYEYVLFGGAAGPGKSYILRWGAVWFLWKMFREHGLRGVHVGLFCETYQALQDRHITKLQVEFPPWLGEMRRAAHDFVLAEELGGGVISFRNLDDPAKYRSVEFAAIFVDELTMNDRRTFDLLRSRKRWVGVTHSPFVAATNPTERGLPWVRRLWIERSFSGEEDQGLNPDSFHFIPALPSDNRYLPTSYYETLKSLPPNLRRALLEGDWYVFQGQALPELQPTRDGQPYHVIPFQALPKHWRRYEGHDWGYASLCYTCWVALDPDGGGIVYKELGGRGWAPDESARRLLEVRGLDKVVWTWAGHDLWAEHRSHLTSQALATLKAQGQAELSLADQYQAVGVQTLRVCHNLDRLARLQRFHQALAERSDGVPYLRIMETCPILIRTLQNIALDPSRTEDVRSDYAPNDELRDDPYDALGFVLMSVRGLAEVSRPIGILPPTPYNVRI